MTTLNLTRSLELLVEDIVARVEAFGHIDPSRVLLCVSVSRGGGIHGVYARIHPLRFPGGASSLRVRRGGRPAVLTMPAVTQRGKDILYIIYFLVPRFFDLPRREKLITVFHELFHISPVFDGDIRRFPGRNFAHGSSRRKYNELMGSLVDDYLSRAGDPALHRFLDSDLDTLRSGYRAIVGRKYPVPKVRVER